MKRKITGLLFTFLFCVASFNGFCQEVNFIPLTWEIVREARNTLKEGDYYFSSSFKISLKNNANALDFNNGILVPGGKNSSQNIIKFTAGDKGDKGKLDNVIDSIRGTEALEIFFPDIPDKKNIRLRFMRNNGKNRFELVSAVIDTNNYAFDEPPDEPPYLMIKSGLGVPNIELQAVSISEGHNYPSQSRQGNITFSSGGNISQVAIGNKYGVIYIDGPGSLTKSAVIEYIRHKNPNVSRRIIENLVDTYFREAGKERINHDLAIAQMCRTTNFLGIERIIMQTHNYAGFTSTPEWPGRFTGGMRQGVIAHIQHLKGYTSNARRSDLMEPLADPRWNMIDSFRGTIHTLEDLSKKWAPYNSRGYENDIKDIVNEMRRFSSRLNI